MALHHYASVWDAIEDTPEKALNLRLRSTLMRNLNARIAEWGIAPGAAAERLGLSESRLEDLLAGHIHMFSLTSLLDLTVPAGIRVDLHLVHDPDCAAPAAGGD